MPTDHDAPPEDGTTLARQAAPRAAVGFTLTVSDGPDAGARFTVSPSAPSRALIGKSAACEIRLRDVGVSRRHAAVEVVDSELRLIDLGSTNGTRVNGVRVLQARLEGGETLHLGSTTLRVERDEPRLAPPLPDEASFGTTIGASKAMRRLYPLCAKLAQSNVPVVIEGETGTGKEQLAHALHSVGPRQDGPFVVFDCTAVAPTLIEAELFGHEKGAFTGATASRAGVFEQASGGTILIDEIGDLPLNLQPKLLRAIERLEVTRVGSNRPVVIDVRVVAATRRNLDDEVQLGRFRDDLFHRVAVVRIELPPLRERRGDVRLLARHFCREITGVEDALPDELVRRWEDYPWPGNVRELRNAVTRRIALGDLAGESSLATAPGARPRAAFRGEDVTAAVLALNLPFSEAREHILHDFERRYLDHMLALHGGNITRAAAAAGIGRRYFYKLSAKRGGQ